MNETPEEQSARLKQLEDFWDPEHKMRKRECFFYQHCDNDIRRKQGRPLVNLYPDVLTDEEAFKV